jgi:hypothetical protein
MDHPGERRVTAGLETFAKVRALHDATTSPGEKAAAAGRMEALARTAGITVAEALSRLDSATVRASSNEDLLAAWKASWAARAAGQDADAPDAPCWGRRGLPIYDPETIEPWRNVADHCLQLDRMIPKACGGKFLTKDERARLKAVTRYAPVTNADADWIETVLTRCHAARDVWCERDRATEAPTCQKATTESDVEFAARMTTAMKAREASKLDAAEPEPQTAAQAAAETLNAFFSRPEFVAQRAEQDRKRETRRAEVLARYGSVEAVYAETEREAALRVACEPMTAWDPYPDHENYTLDGWGLCGAREEVPPRVRAAVSTAWPLPQTLTDAWAEFITTEEHERARQTMHDGEHFSELWVEVRRYVIEDLLDTLPATSVDDMLLRQSWLEHLNDQGFSRDIRRDTILLATMRADIERMGDRMRQQQEAAVQNGQPAPASAPDHPVSPCGATAQFCAAPSVHSGHLRRPTRAERHAAIRALLADGHTDREVARRLGISPTTVGAVRRQMEPQHGR